MISEAFSAASEWHDIEIATVAGGHIVRYVVPGRDEDGDECLEVRTSVFTDPDTACLLVRRLMRENEKPEDSEKLNEKEIKKAKR